MAAAAKGEGLSKETSSVHDKDDCASVSQDDDGGPGAAKSAGSATAATTAAAAAATATATLEDDGIEVLPSNDASPTRPLVPAAVHARTDPS